LKQIPVNLTKKLIKKTQNFNFQKKKILQKLSDFYTWIEHGIMREPKKKSGFFPSNFGYIIATKISKKTLDFRPFNFIYSFLAIYKAS
jgi:hypothetical protein